MCKFFDNKDIRWYPERMTTPLPAGIMPEKFNMLKKYAVTCAVITCCIFFSGNASYSDLYDDHLRQGQEFISHGKVYAMIARWTPYAKAFNEVKREFITSKDFNDPYFYRHSYCTVSRRRMLMSGKGMCVRKLNIRVFPMSIKPII
jgi:hypothetical protein